MKLCSLVTLDIFILIYGNTSNFNERLLNTEFASCTLVRVFGFVYSVSILLLSLNTEFISQEGPQLNIYRHGSFYLI